LFSQNAPTAFAFAAPHSAVHHYAGALAIAWLAVTAWGTLAVRRPFTLGIARRSVPQAVWHTRAFLRINTVITTAWALSFTLTAAAIAACDATHATAAVTVACQVAGFVVPAVFSSRYPKIAQARLAAAAAR
jgi:hypothetical protein